MEITSSYNIKASSTGARNGLVMAENVSPSIAFSAPRRSQGQPGYWTPEHFLVAAVASCFVSTFSWMATATKFEFISFNLEVQGMVEKDEMGWKFKEVVLRPRLKIVRAKDADRGNRLLAKAKRNCLIGRSLACPLSMESEITISTELAAAQSNADL
ncbi:MAG: OsmC family protein [Candidatus Acidiferrales bacterium]|jgi:organic hydroperoxide reductase OsmC/OhrA